MGCVTAGMRMQLLGIKESALPRITALKQLGCIKTADVVNCPQCNERYLVLIDAGAVDPNDVKVLDLELPLTSLAEQISAEHTSGHEINEVAKVPDETEFFPLRGAATHVSFPSPISGGGVSRVAWYPSCN